MKHMDAIAQFRCWTCGDKLTPGQPFVFIVGAETIGKGISLAPPVHANCARKLAQREAVVFVSTFEVLQDSKGSSSFRFPNPVVIEWYSEGRRMTRAEVMRELDYAEA